MDSQTLYYKRMGKKNCMYFSVGPILVFGVCLLEKMLGVSFLCKQSFVLKTMLEITFLALFFNPQILYYLIQRFIITLIY